MFRAMFDGTCPADCGMRIHPGDIVEYDDDRVLWHAACLPKPPAPVVDVCPDCWIERLHCRC